MTYILQFYANTQTNNLMIYIKLVKIISFHVDCNVVFHHNQTTSFVFWQKTTLETQWKIGKLFLREFFLLPWSFLLYLWFRTLLHDEQPHFTVLTHILSKIGLFDNELMKVYIDIISCIGMKYETEC